MTKSEIQANSIAKQFLAAVRRLEAFQDDPGMVYDDLKVVSCREPKNIKATMEDIENALRGDEVPFDASWEKAR